MITNYPLERFAGLKTPFYYYDTRLLDRTLAAVREAAGKLANSHVHYAVKANANPDVLRRVAEAGLGADCVSGGEMETALAAGIPAERIVFAGVGKSDSEIRLGLERGISCFNVESLPELEVIDTLAAHAGKVADVAFRINPDVDAHTHEKITTGLNENKFGIAMEDMETAIRKAEAMAHVRYVGLHFHVGSQIRDLSVFERLCSRINELQERLDRAGVETRSINVGGGLGIDYENPDANPVPDFEGYFSVFRRSLRLRPRQELHFELGRSVVAQCGTLVSRVLYVKHGHAKDFLILDAGLTELVRPAMYGAYHRVDNLTAAAAAENAANSSADSAPHAGAPESPSVAAPAEGMAVYDVVGPICESSDVFGKARRLPVSRRGDLIALRSAGAYGEAMASTYNCRPLPAAYMGVGSPSA